MRSSEREAIFCELNDLGTGCSSSVRVPNVFAEFAMHKLN